jgi:hypothetical protein
MKLISVFFYLSLINSVSAQVEVKYLNQRFLWISVPSKYVKARMTHPKEKLSICWLEVQSGKEKFEFITRRAVPVDECMHLVSESRKLLKKNNVVEIIGNGGTKSKVGDYFAMFELVRAKSGCVGYFGECESFEKRIEEWNDWKSKPIDPKLYP